MDDNLYDSDEQYELIQQLAEIVDRLGWVIGIPLDAENGDKVSGLIIGTEAFVTDVASVAGVEVESIENETLDNIHKKIVH